MTFGLSESILIIAIASTAIPIIALLLRHRSLYTTIPTITTAVLVALHLGIVLRLIQLASSHEAASLVPALIVSSFALLLSSYVLSLTFGRDAPGRSLQENRRTLALLAVVGIALLAFVRTESFVEQYSWDADKGTIFVGSLGKAYLTLTLVGVVLIGFNLEKTYRIAPATVRHRLRVPLFAAFSALFYTTFLLTVGLLYSSLGLGKSVALAIPVIFASLVTGYGYLQGSLSDVAAPVSRKIVYSSFTAVVAGLLVAAVGLAGQIAGWTSWSPDEILVLAVVILIVLGGILLLFSNRFQRQVRRFIDRNFYVNRYDYRTQWSRVASSFADANGREDVLQASVALLSDVFLADEVTIGLVDRASELIRPVRGKGVDDDICLDRESPLYTRLQGQRTTLLIDRKADDFTYIPIYAENGDWLDRTASQVVAPLFEADRLVGLIGLERGHADDAFTYEDVALLDSIAAHIAAALYSCRLTEAIAESRETELISNLSGMVLHDLKNYLTPLKLAAANLDRYKTEPETVAMCSSDIGQVAERMSTMVHTLSELRSNASLQSELLDPSELVTDALGVLQLDKRRDVDLVLQLDARATFRADPGLLRRVIENLITNALEAMEDGGHLTVRTRDAKRGAAPAVCIEIEDTGVGISADFLRTKLFRPFATTKARGTGLGLYQCRTIVQMHGGELTATSTEGVGTRFQLTLEAERSPDEAALPSVPVQMTEQVANEQA